MGVNFGQKFLKRPNAFITKIIITWYSIAIGAWVHEQVKHPYFMY